MVAKGYFDTVLAEVSAFFKANAGESAASALMAAPLRMVPYLKAGNATHGEENEADKRFAPATVRDTSGKASEVLLVSNVQRSRDSLAITLIHAAAWLVARTAKTGKGNRVYGKAFNAIAADFGLAPVEGASARSSQYFAVREDSPLSRWLSTVKLPDLPETFDGTGEGVASGAAMVKVRAPESWEVERDTAFYLYPAPNWAKDPDKARKWLKLNKAHLFSGTHKHPKTNEITPDHKPTFLWCKAVKALRADSKAA
jgi:hypothetical protein